MRKIEVEIDGVIAIARLLDDKAPKTCEAIYRRLPSQDRTIHVRWSGSAWRTEKNYQLGLGEIENSITRVEIGDLIYYDDPRYNLYKIALAYGPCEWRDPAGTLPVTQFARLEDNRDALLKACARVLYDGPKIVNFRPIP